MEYVIEDNRIILIDGSSIQTLWFKDLNNCIISGTDIFFNMTWGNEMVKLPTITSYNGGSCIPPNVTIYNETMLAIKNFENKIDITGSVNMQIIQDKFTRDHDPLPTDDMNHDYNVFCQWKNSVTGDLFQCMDNTPNAAVWKRIQFVEL
jgi:hypothetical protein